MIVLDSSAVLAILQSEPGAEYVLKRCKGSAFGAVNLGEVISAIMHGGGTSEAAARNVARLQLAIYDFDAALAHRTGELRPVTRFLGLSLGDRACLALAERLGAKVLTGDRHWARLDLGIEIELFR